MRHSLSIALFLCALAVGKAEAACTITGVQSVSGNVVTVPSFSSVNGATVTISLTLTLNKSGNGGCTASVAFKGILATPKLINGSSTLNYTIPQYYTSTPSSRLTGTGTANNQATVQMSVSTTLTIPAGQPGPGGGYTDSSVIIEVFDGTLSIVPVTGSGVALSVTATLQNTCTIGGSASGGTQTLNFSNGATISIAAKTANFASVTCNSPATITLTSSNGAAKTAAASGSTHNSFFDYVASTTVNSASVTLDTSTNPAATGAESASSSIAATTTSNAPLAITVTPKPPSKPLTAGSYADVLTITISPN